MSKFFLCHHKQERISQKRILVFLILFLTSSIVDSCIAIWFCIISGNIVFSFVCKSKECALKIKNVSNSRHRFVMSNCSSSLRWLVPSWSLILWLLSWFIIFWFIEVVKKLAIFIYINKCIWNEYYFDLIF